MSSISIVVFLLFGISFVGMMSKKYNFPLPIALVVGGILISLIPQLPVVTLNPEVVFLIFLPPLLYEAAWNTSWREFKSNIRPISFAAIGLVVFTTLLVGYAVHWLIPGISWPVSFLIGAIVSPPDAIAATAVTKGLGLNPRILSILEGESLLNDASGLVAYKYALGVIIAGNFVYWEAGLNFVMIAVAGVAIGLAIGFLMDQVQRRIICDPVVEAGMTLLIPFASYLLAEHFHFSGVLAVVSTGLFMSFRSGRTMSHQGRIMAYSLWEVLPFLLNGFVFVLIGLQLRSVMEGISNYPTIDLVIYGLAVSFAVIIVRFIWVIPSTFLPRFLSSKIQKEELDIRNVVIFGWAGMRGVVSMAAALALPLTINGAPFAERNLVIYLTFCVILVTLLGLGLTLPWIIKKMKISPFSLAGEEYEVRTEVVNTAIGHIEENYSHIHDGLLYNIKSKYEVKYNRLQSSDLPSNYFGQGKTLGGNIFNEFTKLQIDLLTVERDTINTMHHKGIVSDVVARKIEHELDLEETRLNMEIYSA